MELRDVGVLGNAFDKESPTKIDCCAISDVCVKRKLQRIIASDCVSFATLVVADFSLRPRLVCCDTV